MNSTLDSAKVKLRSCKHCGKKLGEQTLDLFCCSGCETVYSILQSEGLSYFYDLKKNGVCLSEAHPVNLNHRLHFSDWKLAPQQNEVNLYIEGVHCSACLWLLEKLPLLLPEALVSAKLDLRKSILNLVINTQGEGVQKNLERVASQIKSWGYTPHLIEAKLDGSLYQTKENRTRLVELGIAGAIAGNVMLMSIPLYSGIEGPFRTLFEWISCALSIPSLFYSGRSFFKNVKSGFQTKTFPIDGPILLALLTAFFYSLISLIQGTHQLYFDSLTALIFLLLASRYYLMRMRQSSALSLGTLDFFKSTDAGKLGDRVSFQENQTLQFDGVVREGDLWVDTSKFSGESAPVHLKVGDLFYAGSELLSFSEINQTEILATGNDTRLSELMRKVETCQRERTRVEQLSDQLAKKLLKVVLALGLVMLTYFLTKGMKTEALTRFLALLIVTCPCALALATPLVLSLAMKALFKKGLLVKDPNSLDFAAQVSEICFDKTGTLTEGKLSVTTPLNRLLPATQSLLFSLTSRSSHPVSRAIYLALSEMKLPDEKIEWSHFEEKPGVGLFASTPEKAYRLVRSQNTKHSETEVSLFQDLKGASYEIARISLNDQLRNESASVIQELKNKNYTLRMLSGDHLLAAKKIAHEAGIEEVLAELSPEEKAAQVKNAIMIGDGLNDALALSSAKISIAVQGGMNAAIQSSQIYSLKPGISGILPFLSVANTVKSTLKVNFTLSTGYNFIGAILSLSGYMNPLFAAILMPLSALSVFSYSLWRFKKI